MAPAPLIKMKLILLDDIKYIPVKSEIIDTFMMVLEEIVHITATIPRLFEKFALPAGGLKRFQEVVRNDTDCNELQNLINQGILFVVPLS